MADTNEVINTAKSGKHYQRTATGLQLIHLETDTSQVLSSAEITKIDGTNKWAAGTTIQTILAGITKDVKDTIDDLPDTNTTYSINTGTGNTVVLTGSDGTTLTRTINNVAHATAADSATTATTATNLASAPVLAEGTSSGTTPKVTPIKVTVGGQTSADFTVPYATSASSALSATSAVNDAYGNKISTTYATKAELPTVNDGKLTIKVAGTEKQTFTANQSTAVEVDITAADLGLSSAMHFLGVTTTKIADASTTNPIIINGESVTAKAGDVVLYGSKEFVWTSSAWEELGDEGSHALKSITITGTDGLEGGGSLEQNRTISHSDVTRSDTTSTATPAAKGEFTVVDSVSTNAKGHVTAINVKTVTLPEDKDTHFTTGLYVGESNKKANAAVTSPYLKLYDDSTKRAEFQIKGAGGTSVSSDASGNITITSSSYDLPTASSTSIGGIKLGSDTVQTVAASAVTSTASRTYATQLNSAGQLVVNVPWTDTTEAEKLDHSVTFKLTSDVTGSASSTLEGNEVSITTTIGDGKVTEAKLAAVPSDAAVLGTYSAVKVSTKGRIISGAQVVKYVETAPTTAPEDLAVGGTLYYVY